MNLVFRDLPTTYHDQFSTYLYTYTRRPDRHIWLPSPSPSPTHIYVALNTVPRLRTRRGEYTGAEMMVKMILSTPLCVYAV